MCNHAFTIIPTLSIFACSDGREFRGGEGQLASPPKRNPGPVLCRLVHYLSHATCHFCFYCVCR